MLEKVPEGVCPRESPGIEKMLEKVPEGVCPRETRP